MIALFTPLAMPRSRYVFSQNKQAAILLVAMPISEVEFKKTPNILP
jgi:hypothetical protein